MSNSHVMRPLDSERDDNGGRYRHGEATVTVMIRQRSLFRLTDALVDKRDNSFARWVSYVEIADAVQHTRQQVDSQHQRSQHLARQAHDRELRLACRQGQIDGFSGSSGQAA